ncbi:MAG: hypothetical protein ACXVC6_07680 [Bacteroidia bacterium]
MKKLIIVFMATFNLAFAQDQIILRETHKAIWDELKIVNVTADSIAYKPHGRDQTIITIPIKDIIAYRKDYDSDTKFVVPDSSDRGKYYFREGRALENEIPIDKRGGMVRTDIAMALREYAIRSEFGYEDLINNNRVAFVKKINGRGFIKTSRARMYLVIDKKSTGQLLYVETKKYKFTTGDTLFFKWKYKQDKSFYAVKLSDIKSMGIQTPGMIIAKISIGLVEMGLPFVYCWRGGIVRMIRPMYRKIDLQKWEIIVSGATPAK